MRIFARKTFVLCLIIAASSIVVCINVFLLKRTITRSTILLTLSQHDESVTHKVTTSSSRTSGVASNINTCYINASARTPTFVFPHEVAKQGHLRHVKAVLTGLGYSQVNLSCEWDVMWCTDYPFARLNLRNLKPHQRVNHFPGTASLIRKVQFSSSNSQNIPRSFRIPEEKNQLLEFARRNPNITFMQKGNDHRGVRIKKVEEINLKAKGAFVQEYLHDTVLIDGHRFVIGLYIILTALNPLRVYAYYGDVLFRFCPQKYHPFDPKFVDKYVCGNDYLPIWEVPSLKYLYTEQGYSMKDTFDVYLEAQGNDPKMVWKNINRAVESVFLMKAPELEVALKGYASSSNFFEMYRVDLMLKADLSVYILEVNMSPSLSSIRFPRNQLLYEQLVYNTLEITGIAARATSSDTEFSTSSEQDMIVALKNILVFPKVCNSETCRTCDSLDCNLCKRCLNETTIRVLKSAYREHVRRVDSRRIFPPPLEEPLPDMTSYLQGHSDQNRLLGKWFLGKCMLDKSWCV